MYNALKNQTPRSIRRRVVGVLLHVHFEKILFYSYPPPNWSRGLEFGINIHLIGGSGMHFWVLQLFSHIVLSRSIKKVIFWVVFLIFWVRSMHISPLPTPQIDAVSWNLVCAFSRCPNEKIVKGWFFQFFTTFKQ